MNFPELKTLPTQEEIDALRAQVEQLKVNNQYLLDALIGAGDYWNGDTNEAAMLNALDNLDNVIWAAKEMIPAQCLAEIKAQGYAQGFYSGYQQCSIDEDHGQWYAHSEQLSEYSAREAENFLIKLRQGAKEKNDE